MKANVSVDGKWCKPLMSVENQSAFWDAQSDSYEKTEMTNDNQSEMDVVISKCREVPMSDIVTLGGAIGCRDPKLILDDLIARDPHARPTVIFNDLSVRQVERARKIILAGFAELGFDLSYLPGQIQEVCRTIESCPRRLMIGVYDCRSFFKADPQSGYPLCGFDEYLKNHNILGEEFLMDWVRLSASKHLVSLGVRAKVRCGDDPEIVGSIKDALALLERKAFPYGVGGASALQIIGQTVHREGFFISHWYTPFGMSQMIHEIFPREDFLVASNHFAKGTVFTIDPIGKTPTGIVTVLNNVIGNVLPDDQYETLKSIKRIVV